MPRTLFLLFNHQLTPLQETDARQNLGVDGIVAPPPELQHLWSGIPPDPAEIGSVCEPFRAWLDHQARQGDLVLLQGDFGACYLMVQYALRRGLIPVYSTTTRRAVEELQEDGSMKLTHYFYHRRFREYGG
jgi:hypothetical protein